MPTGRKFLRTKLYVEFRKVPSDTKAHRGAVSAKRGDGGSHSKSSFSNGYTICAHMPRPSGFGAASLVTCEEMAQKMSACDLLVVAEYESLWVWLVEDVCGACMRAHPIPYYLVVRTYS